MAPFQARQDDLEEKHNCQTEPHLTSSLGVKKMGLLILKILKKVILRVFVFTHYLIQLIEKNKKIPFSRFTKRTRRTFFTFQ